MIVLESLPAIIQAAAKAAGFMEINKRHRDLDDPHLMIRGLHPYFDRHAVTRFGDRKLRQCRNAVCLKTTKRISDRQPEPLVELSSKLRIDLPPLCRRLPRDFLGTQIAAARREFGVAARSYQIANSLWRVLAVAIDRDQHVVLILN